MDLSHLSPTQFGIVVAIVVVIVVAMVALVWLSRRVNDRRMRKRYGPEYDRLVTEMGSRKRAERRLVERERRVSQYDIRPLSEMDRARYLRVWQSVQAHFVDNPGEAVAKADQLLGEAMTDRGYPMADFDRRSADVSVHYPRVVQNYRAGHDIALSCQSGKASTEDLRRAMIHYRELFEELVTDDRLQDARAAA
jgi:class 3 adenylate cyclase